MQNLSGRILAGISYRNTGLIIQKIQRIQRIQVIPEIYEIPRIPAF